MLGYVGVGMGPPLNPSLIIKSSKARSGKIHSMRRWDIDRGAFITTYVVGLDSSRLIYSKNNALLYTTRNNEDTCTYR